MPSLPPFLLRWGCAGLFATALAAAFWQMPAAEAPAFALPATASERALPAEMSLAALPIAAEMAGPASLALLPDGRLAAAWLAGPNDDESAAAIWLVTLGRNGWSTPQRAASRESTAAGTFAHLNKLGRPVLFSEGGWLHLWFEGLPLGDWAGALIAHSVSTDGGKSWSKAERLSTSPLVAMGSGLGGPPLALADGGLGLPIDQHFLGQSGEWLRLSATGRVLGKQRMAHEQPALQLSVAAIDQQQALAVLRGNALPGGLTTMKTEDGSRSWQAGNVPELSNSAAPFALLRLNSGRLLLAGNPQQGKEALHLWLSADAGRTWALKRTVETAADGGAEFAWPALAQGRDGWVHLAYTWRRQAIKHARFSEAWLDGGAP